MHSDSGGLGCPDFHFTERKGNMSWIVFVVSRRANQYSVRIDNGQGYAIEFPCLNGVFAEQLALEFATSVRDAHLGSNVKWDG